MIYDDIPDLVANFLKYMRTIKNRSDTTVREYYYDLKLIFRYLKVYKARERSIKG